MLRAGQTAFALGLLGFGAVGFLYVDFLNALQPVPRGLPGYATLAVSNAAALTLAGVLILLDRAVREAAIALLVGFGLCVALLQVPSAFTDPALLRSPWWIRTFETVALGGGALSLAAMKGEGVQARWLGHGRVLFGVAMPVFGVLHLVYPGSVASLVPPWYPWPLFWAYVTGAAQVAAGVAIASGHVARMASLLAGAMYGLWALTLHVPRIWCRLYGPCDFMGPAGGREGLRPGLTSLFVAVAMCGAAWIVSAGVARQRAPHEPEPGR